MVAARTHRHLAGWGDAFPYGSTMIEEKSDKVCVWLRAIGSDAIGSHPPPGRDRAKGEVEIMLAARPHCWSPCRMRVV